MRGKTVSLYFSNSNHGSLLIIVLRALQQLDCKIILFLTEGLNQSVYSSQRVVHQMTISNAKFTQNAVFKHFKMSDMVIIDQLYSFRELFSFSVHDYDIPTLMLIHNCNTWFHPGKPKRLVDKAKHFMTQRIRKKIGFFAVAGENMYTYVRDQLGIDNVGLIPFRYDDFDRHKDIPHKAYSYGSPIRLAVPGMISHRRNYHELLNSICISELKGKIELVLLGRPDDEYGIEIIAKAKDLNNQGYKITFWNEFISDSEFENEIHKAHLLFSYFDSKYKTNNGQEEIYGISKETGISLLMYNKAKVGLLPATFNQMESIRNQTIFYQDFEELRGILLSVYEGNTDLEGLILNAIQNASSMNLGNIIQQLELAYENQLNIK